MLIFLSNLDMGASPVGVAPDLDFYPDPYQAVWIIKDGTSDPL